ncbi:MAG: hypothetical protein A2W35_02975 [Chloroflexi bacterium RBG_16_57_11]|nr:MAG: hypothetical protein A2W35_02975 [Chloroflexi bacterium RBG_16_57_11]
MMQTFSKPITEIIRWRFSCRTYLERPIERDLQLRIAEYAVALGPGPFGGQARFKLIAAEEVDRFWVLERHQEIIRAMVDRAVLSSNGTVRLEGVLDGSEISRFDIIGS